MRAACRSLPPLAAIAVAVLLAGCGGSSTHVGVGAAPTAGGGVGEASVAPSNRASASSTPTPAQLDAAAAPSSPQAARARDRYLAAHDRLDHLARGNPVEHATAPPGAGDDEQSPTGATVQNPCTLVTRAQIAGIIHEPVAAGVEAPLGPTCVYHAVRHGGGDFTISVQTARIGALSKLLRHQVHLRIAHHAAYCGIIGEPMMYTELAAGQVLTVGAPCQVAATITADALRHVRENSAP